MSVTSQQYAFLADHSYGPPTDQERRDGISVDGVKFEILDYVDRPSGYQGTIYQRADTGEIVVAHRGTEFEEQFVKDLVITDSAMVLTRVNLQAPDAIELTRRAMEMASEIGRDRGNAPEVTVTGHSLGGTLTEITAHHFDLRGETFDSFGAVGLNRRIPEGGDRLINHVTATDVVSAASPHYGQVRVYATQEGIGRLREVGDYGNQESQLDFRRPLPVAAVSLTPAHKMHHFLNVDGEGQPDVSLLRDPQARRLAAEYAPMIEKYRNDVGLIRSGASLGGDGLRMLGAGPLLMPQRSVEQIRDALQPELAAGEPARLEAERVRVAAEGRVPEQMHSPARGEAWRHAQPTPLPDFLTPDAPPRSGIAMPDYLRPREQQDGIPTLPAVSAVAPPGMRQGTDRNAGDAGSAREPRQLLADDPSHPDFDTFHRIHGWVRGTGQWDEEKSRNVAGALYKEQAADPLLQRVDRVCGAMGRDGAENVFAVYAPYGDQGPFFRAQVDGREACQQPARQSLEQAEQIRQQALQQKQDLQVQQSRQVAGGPAMSM